MTIDSSTGMVPTGTKLCDEWVVERHNRTELLVEVYQVRSPRLGRTVARVLGVGGAQAEGFVKALGALRGVEHKALAPVVAVGKEPCGVVVISGTPEAATLRELWQRGGRMKASEVGRMVTEVSLALETLHANAPVVVHRALSPEVIALAVQPARVWLDAWWLAHCVVEAGILPAEFPLAAPEYRAPDDLLGRVHPRSDIFALASVAFEALTGSLAYEPGSSEAKILRGERPLVSALRPEMPPELDAVLARAWSQEQPFPNPIAFARELSRVVGSATGSQPGFLSPLAARSRAVHMDLTRPVVALPRPEAITPERNGSLHSNPTRQLQVPPRVEALRSDEVPGEDDVDKAFDAMLNSTERRDSQGSPPPSQPAPEPTPGEEWAASVPGTRASRPPASSTPPSPLRSIRPTLVSGVPPRPSGVKTAPPPLPAGITTARHKAVVPPPPPPQAPPEVELVDADEDEDRTEAGVFPSEALRQALEAAEQATRETPTSGLGATQKVLVPKLRPPPVAPQGGARTADQSDRWSSMERPVLPSVAPPAPPPMASARPAAPPQSAQPPEEVAQDRWEASPTAPHGTAVATPVPVPMPSPAAPVAAPAWTSPEPLREPPIVANRRTPEPAPGERTTPAGRPTAPDGTNAPPVVAPRPSQPPLPAVPVMAPRPPGPPVAVTPPSLPPEDPLAVRVARILGTSIVLGSLVVTSGQIYLSRQLPTPVGPPAVARMSVAPAIPGVEAPPLVAPSPPPLVGVMDAAPASPTLAVGDGSVAPTAEDAPAVLAAADVEAVAPDVGLLATAGDSAAPAPAADPPPTPVVAADAAVAPTVAASSPPLEDHPKVRDVVRVTNSLRSRVLSCIAGRRSRRHVRVLAEYEGATGRVFSVRLVGGYADPPTGPCIEGAVRALPYTPFREERWTQSYVYNLGD